MLRATPLRPLTTVTVGLILVAVAASWRSSRAPDVLGTIAVGALAAGVALGLDDEAATMLRSSPTGAFTRLALRIVSLAPALLGAVASLLVADRLLFAARTAVPPLAALGALVMTGIAVDVWSSRRWPEASAEGAAVAVMAWVLAGLLAPDVWLAVQIADAWRAESGWVLAVAAGVAVAGTCGQGA